VSFDEHFVRLLDEAYRHWTGQGLPAPEGLGREERLVWLHEQAPYSLLAHDGAVDPRFTYVNECALRCFKYPREDFIGMHAGVVWNLLGGVGQAALFWLDEGGRGTYPFFR